MHFTLVSMLEASKILSSKKEEKEEEGLQCLWRNVRLSNVRKEEEKSYNIRKKIMNSRVPHEEEHQQQLTHFAPFNYTAVIIIIIIMLLSTLSPVRGFSCCSCVTTDHAAPKLSNDFIDNLNTHTFFSCIDTHTHTIQLIKLKLLFLEK